MLIASALAPILATALAAAPASGMAPKNRPYDVEHYRIDVRLKADGSFTNKAAIRLKPKRSTTTLELDAYALDVSAVKASTGQDVTFTVADDAASRTGRLTLRSKKPFAAGREITFEIDYSGKASTSAHEGLFQIAADTKDGAPFFFTHFQPNAAQQFFPANDQPDDKATSELFVVTDRRYTVISNGKKVKDEAFAEGGENLRRVHWLQETPHSTYLVALAVGEFEPVAVGSAVPATIWVRKGTADRAFISRAATLNTLGFLTGLTKTKYPWAKYDQVAVPRFFWNGMENTSLVMMREDALVLDTKTHFYGHARQLGLVAHEAAHQWFGDYVTPKGWEDTWLNEGFATYVGSLAVDDHYENDFVDVTRARYLFVDYVRDDAGPRARPLVSRGVPSVEAMFDSTSYAKGAAVLRMLDFWMGSDGEPGSWKAGSEPFRETLKAYLAKYAHSNASSQDFFAVAQRVANETAKKAKKKPSRAPSLRGFENSWLKKRGYPILTPETSWDGSSLTVKITQRPSASGEKGPFVFKLPVVFQRSSTPKYAIERTILIDKAVTTFKVDLPANPQWVNWNKEGVALAQVWPSSVDEQQWIAAARRDPDPVWRLLALHALTAELASNELKEAPKPTDSVVGTLLDVITQDPSPYVREALMHRLSGTKWKRLPLPEDFGRQVLAVAKRPQKLPEDAMGTIRVRRAALELLGKLDYKPGHEYLVSTLTGSALAEDLNYLPALTAGTARIGESNATASLFAAVNGQHRRGYVYFRSAAESLGSIASEDGLVQLAGFFESLKGNEEIAKGILGRLAANDVVRTSPQLPKLIANFVLAPNAFSDDVRARALRVLDDVKTPEAQQALMRIYEKSPSSRIKGSAGQVLSANFPSAKATTIPAKGKKRK